MSAGDSGGWPWHPPLPATCNLRPFSPQLAGGVILGVALWLRHDPQTTSILYLELGDRPAPNTFYVGECERHWPGSQHGGPSRCLIGSSVRCRQAVREGFQEEAGPEQACCALWWGGGQPGTLALGLRVRRWDTVQRYQKEASAPIPTAAASPSSRAPGLPVEGRVLWDFINCL